MPLWLLSIKCAIYVHILSYEYIACIVHIFSNKYMPNGNIWEFIELLENPKALIATT